MGLDKVFELGKKFLDDKKVQREADEAAKAEELKKDSQEPEKKEPVEKKEEPQEPLKKEPVVELNEDEEDSLLERDEQELSDDEKAKKVELARLRDEESAEIKIARVKRKSEKRINNLVDKLKNLDSTRDAEKKALSEKITALEAKLDGLAKPSVDQGYVDAEKTRIAQYLEEDKNLPKEQRREMTAEEWEELNEENPLEAQRWVQRNESRRKDDREADVMKDTAKDNADKFIGKQNESVARMLTKYPNTRPTARVEELKAEGKGLAEVQETLNKEFPEYEICDKIVKENPDWIQKENFGDLVLAELDKRIADYKKPEPKEEPKLFTEEEVQKKIEEATKMESTRRENVDTSITSTRNGSNVLNKVPQNKSEKLAELEKIYVKAGKDPALAAIRLEERAKIPGATNYDPLTDK